MLWRQPAGREAESTRNVQPGLADWPPRIDPGIPHQEMAIRRPPQYGKCGLFVEEEMSRLLYGVFGMAVIER
jgi:hypothetical protein